MRIRLAVVLFSIPLAFAAACSSGETTSSSSSGTADPGAPAAPTNLAAAQMGPGIHLTWKDNAADEAEYQIERREGEGQFARIASVTFDVVQYHDTGVAAAKTYTYRARAVSSAGKRSAYSNDVSMAAPSTATGTDGGTDSGPGIDWDGGAVSFSAHIIPLFERSCGTGNSSCHVRDAYGASSAKACRGWLSLENAPLGAQFYGGAQAGQSTGCPDRSLYDRLTQLDAWQEPGAQTRKYVKPGDSANSYLFNKIAGGPYGDDRPGVASTPMPQPPRAALSATEIAMVKKWIDTGAPK
ncbi:MAG: fibronectin type III domain-containing protein [Deltaproteobacteria bacterium]|nr:fibronectin type III domain-containing protein [Deltaproteobacteria bacterium]